MIKPGRPVKDISITKDTDIEKIFLELQQSGGFESRNLAEGLDILSNMISLSSRLIVGRLFSNYNIMGVTLL